MTMLSDAEWLDRNAKVIEEFRANGGRLERQDLVLLTTTGAVRPVAEQVARWARVDHDAVTAAIAAVTSAEPIVVTVGPLA